MDHHICCSGIYIYQYSSHEVTPLFFTELLETPFKFSWNLSESQFAGSLYSFGANFCQFLALYIHFRRGLLLITGIDLTIGYKQSHLQYFPVIDDLRPLLTPVTCQPRP